MPGQSAGRRISGGDLPEPLPHNDSLSVNLESWERQRDGKQRPQGLPPTSSSPPFSLTPLLYPLPSSYLPLFLSSSLFSSTSFSFFSLFSSPPILCLSSSLFLQLPLLILPLFPSTLSFPSLFSIPFASRPLSPLLTLFIIPSSFLSFSVIGLCYSISLIFLSFSLNHNFDLFSSYLSLKSSDLTFLSPPSLSLSLFHTLPFIPLRSPTLS